MPDGTVVAIFIGDKARAPMKQIDAAVAVPGKGLLGDRYFESQGTFFSEPEKQFLPDKEVTLTEQEALDALLREYNVELLPHESRRNILTTGVALNHLVGREFTVGGARLLGIRLCEPCKHLESLAGRNLKGLTHRGGLRAEVLKEGEIRAGDRVVPLETPGKRFSPEFSEMLKVLGCEGGGHQ